MKMLSKFHNTDSNLHSLYSNIFVILLFSWANQLFISLFFVWIFSLLAYFDVASIIFLFMFFWCSLFIVSLILTIFMFCLYFIYSPLHFMISIFNLFALGKFKILLHCFNMHFHSLILIFIFNAFNDFTEHCSDFLWFLYIFLNIWIHFLIHNHKIFTYFTLKHCALFLSK